MNDLSLSEYKKHCDKMNYNDLYSGENLTGRHVSIHVKLFKQKIFKSEEGKERRVGNWTDVSNVKDDVWEITLYNERAEDYVSDFGMLFFKNTENIEPSNLSKEETLIIYGQIINHPEESYDDWEILVRYYELD